MTVDPGLRRCGLAIGDAKKIHWCEAIRTNTDHRGSRAVEEMIGALRVWYLKSDPDEIEDVDIIVVEDQQYFGVKSKRSNPQDLIDLSKVAGAAFSFLSLLKPTVLVTASEWKGTQHKIQTHRRAYNHYGLSFDVRGGDEQKNQYGVVTRGAPCPSATKNEDWKEIGDAIAICNRVTSPGLRATIQKRAGL